jgi:hypothetical protein
MLKSMLINKTINKYMRVQIVEDYPDFKAADPGYDYGDDKKRNSKIKSNLKKQRKLENLPNITPEMNKEILNLAKGIEMAAWRLMRLMKRGDEQEWAVPMYASKIISRATHLSNLTYDLAKKYDTP